MIPFTKSHKLLTQEVIRSQKFYFPDTGDKDFQQKKLNYFWKQNPSAYPLPNEDIVNDGSPTEDNPKADHHGGDDGGGLVEMEKCEKNNSWKMLKRCTTEKMII